VSAKLTPEIGINNATSNSRLIAAARQATAADSHSQTCLQTLFFSLPITDKKTTKLQLHAKKHTETVLHLNLGHFVGFFFGGCSFVLLYASPLMRQHRTTSETPSPALEAEGRTPKLLRLKLHCI
jgi:hypothetical protein